MKLIISNVEFQDPQIPHVQSMFLSVEYKDIYRPILPCRVDTLSTLDYNLSRGYSVAVDVPDDFIQLNRLVSVDLYGLFLSPKAKSEELVAAPIKNQKIDLLEVMNQMAINVSVQQDICLIYDLSNLSQDLAELYTPTNSIGKGKESQAQEQVPPALLHIYCKLEIADPITLPSQVVKIYPEKFFGNHQMWQFQSTTQANFQATIIVNNKHTYVLGNGRVIQNEEHACPCIELNDKVQFVKETSYILEFPEYSAEMINYKQFQQRLSQFAQLVAQAFEADKAQQTKEKKKPVVVKPSIEAIEAFSAASHANINQQYLNYVLNDNTDIISSIKVVVEPKASLLLNLTGKDKAVPQKSPLYFNIARGQFNSQFEKSVINVSDTRLFAEIVVQNFHLKQRQSFHSILIPYDKKIHAELFNEGTVPKDDAAPKESRKYTESIDYKDDQSFNRIYSNQIIGVQAILQKFDTFEYQKYCIPALSSKTGAIQAHVTKYLENRSDCAAVCAFYKDMTTYAQYPLAFGAQQRIFETPNLTFTVLTDNPIIYASKIQTTNFKDLESYRLVNRSIAHYSHIMFNEKGELLSYEPINQEEIIQEKAQGMLQFIQVRQQQLTKCTDYQKSQSCRKPSEIKAMTLRGIQGIQNQQLLKPKVKAENERLDFDYDRYKQQLQGEGIVDIFMQQFINYAQQLVHIGFSCETEMVNYYKNLVHEVVGQMHSRFEVLAKQSSRLKEVSQKSSHAVSDVFKVPDILGKIGGVGRQLRDAAHNSSQQQLETKKKPSSSESFLLERGQINQEEKDFVRFVKDVYDDILLLTATNFPEFLYIVEKLSAATLNKYIETDPKPSFDDALDLFDRTGISRLIADILLCRLISGMRLAQPMEIYSQEDYNHYDIFIIKTVGFLKQLIGQDAWLTIFGQSQQLCIISSALLMSEDMIQVDFSLEHGNQQGPGDGNSTQEGTMIRPTQIFTPRIKLDLQYTKLLEPLLRDRKMALTLLFRRLHAVDNERQTEQKHEILQRYENNQLFANDILLYFEIMDLQRPKFDMNSQYIGFISQDIEDKMASVQANKRQQLDLLSLAFTKSAKYQVQEPDAHIVAAYIYLMYKMGILDAREISDTIQSTQLEIVKAHDNAFKENFKEDEVIQERITAQLNASTSSNSSTLRKGANPSQLLVGLQFQQQKQFNHLIKLISMRPQQTTQQLSMQHLTATQEFYLNNHFDLRNYVFQIKTYKSSEEYMDAFLLAFGHESNAPPEVIKGALLITLAEYLIKRNEKFLAQEALKLCTEMTSDVSKEQLQGLSCRIYFARLSIMSMEKKHYEVLETLDKIKSNELGVAFCQRIRNYPGYSLMRAQTLYEVSNMPDIDKNDTELLRAEVARNCANAIQQAQRAREFDEIWRGSTLTGESGFVDMEFTWKVVETFLLCSPIVSSLQQLDREQLEKELLTTSQDTDNQQIDFLRAQITQRYSMSKLKPSFQVNNSQVSGQTNLTGASEASPQSEAPQQAEIALNIEQTPLLQAGTTEAVADRQLHGIFQRQKQEVLRKQRAAATDDRQDAAQTLQQEINKSAIIQTRRSGHSERNHRESVKALVRNLAMGDSAHGGDAGSDRGAQKQLLALTMTAKAGLEAYPSFGPLWATLGIAQLAMGNPAEARFSASLSTLMHTYVVQDWLCWALCQALAQLDPVEERVYREITPQLDAMNAAGSSWGFLWDFIHRFNSSLAIRT